MTKLRIGLAQVRQVDNLEKNSDRIFKFLEQASNQGVQIICFPETQTVGYRVDIVETKKPVPVDTLRKLHTDIANRCGELGIACILGTETPNEADPENGKPYNSALVINEQGRILGVHHKTKLTPLDALVYSQGNSFETFDLFGVKIGVVICFEGFRFAETTQECVRQGAQLVFHPQNNTTRPNDWKLPIHHAMIVTRAAENTIWFASCNACMEPYQNCSSMIVAPNGKIHAQSELMKEELLVTDINIESATRAMFNYDLKGCTPLLFSDTVSEDELK